MSSKRFPYGGQAVLEGVMMRGLRQASVAVRHPSGEIVFKHEPLNVQRRHTWENLPFLRGVLMLWDALNLGTRALNFSASVAISAEEDAQSGGQASKPPSDTMITITMIVSLLFGVGLFFILPTLLASLADRYGATSFVREGLKSLLQLGLFVGYIGAISRMPEVARLFGFHGAEHKTINAYEAGAPLTVDSVRKFTLIHPRCGTSFLLVVLLINWIVSFLLVRDWPLWARLVSHIPLIPLIAAISYELLRLSAKNYHRAWVRTLVAPSLMFQKLTTREPDDQMIAVAIAALLPVLAADQVMLPDHDKALTGGIQPLAEPSIEPKQVYI